MCVCLCVCVSKKILALVYHNNCSARKFVNTEKNEMIKNPCFKTIYQIKSSFEIEIAAVHACYSSTDSLSVHS